MIDNAFEHAVSELEYAKMKQEERALYDAQLAFISDHVSGLNHAKREGKAEGMAETLKRLATKKFGTLSPEFTDIINKMSIS